MKQFLLAALLASTLAACAVAPSSNLADPGNPPREPPFGKGNASNDSLHQPSGGAVTASPSDPIPPRDPPFGKGT